MLSVLRSISFGNKTAYIVDVDGVWLLSVELVQLGEDLVGVEASVLDQDAGHDVEGLSVLPEGVLVQGLDLVGFLLDQLGQGLKLLAKEWVTISVAPPP